MIILIKSDLSFMIQFSLIVFLLDCLIHFQNRELIFSQNILFSKYIRIIFTINTV